ncbi:MAG: dihydroxyacetone kinase subunit DhaK [Brevinema sp.]
MKKIINATDTIVRDTAYGLVKAYDNLLVLLENTNVIARKNKQEGKVGVVIGNGSGHEPACIGFVGEGMLDANAFGEVFTAPDPITISRAIVEGDQGAGVVLLISNHMGDVLNSNMAIDFANDENIVVKKVILYDDIASAPKEVPQERRGTAGTFFSYKMVGSSADIGYSLDDVARIAEKVRDNTRALTVATLPGTSPITGLPMFELPQDKVQIGIGIHGESSNQLIPMGSAQALAQQMVEQLLADKPYQSGDTITVLVNGCGQTSYMELLIFYNEVEKLLQQKNIMVYKPAIGSFICTQEMGGIALAFCTVDEELQKLWSYPTNAPGFPTLDI